MSIRLYKVARELNIGLRPAIEFLIKNNDSLDKFIYSPNFKLSDEQYAALVAHFQPNLATRGRVNNLSSKEKNKSHEQYSKHTANNSHDVKNPNSNSSKTLHNKNVKELWKRHIDVQEQILNLRTAPIAIIPNSATFNSGKLTLTINDIQNIDVVESMLASCFKIPIIDLKSNDGYIIIDSEKSIDKKQLDDTSHFAKQNYVHISTLPIIDGYLKKKLSPISQICKQLKLNGIDAKYEQNNLIIKIANLTKLLAIENLELVLPNKATIIFRIHPSPICYLKKRYPNIEWNYVKYIYQYDDGVKTKSVIRTKGGYIKNNLLKKLNGELGLELLSYTYKFYINEDVIHIYEKLKDIYDLPFDKDSLCFIFFTKNKTNSNLPSQYNEEINDYDFKYTRLKKFFYSHFGEENIRIDITFDYVYNREKLEEWKDINAIDLNSWYDELFSLIDDNDTNDLDVSISIDKKQIGIDFIWKESDALKYIQGIINKFPTMDISMVKDHNCRIPLEYNDESLNIVENKLREDFPSIQVEKNNIDGILYFYQEYNGLESRRRIYSNFKRELTSTNFNSFYVSLTEIQDGKVKYLFKKDEKAIKESTEEALKELRGANFQFNNQLLGRLIKVRYPQIIIDFQGDENILNLFQIGAIDAIIPDLFGEIEKLKRLKQALERIYNNTNLKNDNLSKIIFDSSNAEPIKEMDEFINPSGQIFNELKEHLINKHINESQLKAIIKTLYATDIALIQGPPGTGKSTAIAEIIWQHLRKNPNERILLTSETNLAVDNAIDRIVNDCHNIVKPIRIADEEKLESEGLQFSLNAMKRWVETGEYTLNSDGEQDDSDDNITSNKLILVNWLSNISHRAKWTSYLKSWRNLLEHPPYWLRKITFDTYMKHVNTIGATCSSIGEKNIRGNRTAFFHTYCEIFGNHKDITTKEGEKKRIYGEREIVFDLVIQDESSKATPAELALPLIYGKKNVIIGDHRQLPPLLDKEEFLTTLDFLDSKTNEGQEKSKLKNLRSYVLNSFDKLEISHFQRLFENIHGSLKGVFNTQYRMHPDINDVIKQFYIEDGGLECGITKDADDPNMNNPASRHHGINIDGFISPNNHVIWIDTNSPEMLDGTSHINYGEVDAIKWMLSKLNTSHSFENYQSFWTNIEDQQIGIITFYGKQVKLLRKVREDFPNIPIRISTVDKFQGMERNIIIVSMVRSNCIATCKGQKPDTDLYGELGFASQNNMGFAQSPNRLNVALSRAKRLLIIVGNSNLFRQKEIYDNVYKCIENNPNGRIIKYKGA